MIHEYERLNVQSYLEMAEAHERELARSMDPPTGD